MNEIVRYRVTPRVWIGLAVYVGYVALVTAVQSLSGIPYDEWGDSGHNLFFGGGVSLIVSAILLAITTTLLGWWRPTLYERHRSAARWPMVFPAIMAVLLVVNLLVTDWASYDLAFFLASLVLLLVGFTEELTCRGLLLVGLRARLGEWGVWFVSSLLFAVLHLMNIFLGQDAGQTVLQVGLAFLAGTILYTLRRTSGSLIPAMVLHGLWDFSTFASQHGESSSATTLVGGVYILVGIAALVCVRFVIRDADEGLGSGPRQHAH